MHVIENEFTKDVTCLCILNDNNIVVGYSNGRIRLWEYSKPGQLKYVFEYEDKSQNDAMVCKLLPYLTGTFISINDDGVIIMWETDSKKCKMVLRGRTFHVFHCVDSVVLPNNLLVVSGRRSSNGWSCFDVWDFDTKECIYDTMENDFCIRNLGLTAQGLLVVASDDSVSVWKINRKVCQSISRTRNRSCYSMAILPAGEIVITSGSDVPYQKFIHFYRFSFDEELHLQKTLHNRNLIDTIHPVAGHYILTVDRKNYKSGHIEMLNLLTLCSLELGDSVVGNHSSRDHVILERKGAILSLSFNKIVIHEFEENRFHFPKDLAELRKNARILSQGQRSESCLFRKLPKEVILRIISLTSYFDFRYTYLNSAKEDLIQNYFCRPMICED